MGYYPFGSKYFSDLLHYVRSGDFVIAVLNDATDLNGYAFALGALSHYASDNSGHPTINQVVAIEFPKLERKYGKAVTYAEDPKAHIRTEFGFDMLAGTPAWGEFAFGGWQTPGNGLGGHLHQSRDWPLDLSLCHGTLLKSSVFFICDKWFCG